MVSSHVCVLLLDLNNTRAVRDPALQTIALVVAPCQSDDVNGVDNDRAVEDDPSAPLCVCGLIVRHGRISRCMAQVIAMGNSGFPSGVVVILGKRYCG